MGQLGHHGSSGLARRLPPELQLPGALLHRLLQQPRGVVVAVLPGHQGIGPQRPCDGPTARLEGGAFPGASIGPWGLSPGEPDGDWGQRSDAAFAALNFIWHYQYTQDIDFLRTTAYPYLREVVQFWEDYLKFEGSRR